jgi:DNA-binding NarL/FixJ family response regulator
MLTQERTATGEQVVTPHPEPGGGGPDTAQSLTILLLALLSTAARPPAPPPPAWPDARAQHAPLSWNDARVHLTARELDVLRLVARGLTNAEIAARLFISRRTVEQHLCSLYNKLGVSTRTAATHFAFRHHLC